MLTVVGVAVACCKFHLFDSCFVHGINVCVFYVQCVLVLNLKCSARVHSAFSTNTVFDCLADIGKSCDRKYCACIQSHFLCSSRAALVGRTGTLR